MTFGFVPNSKISRTTIRYVKYRIYMSSSLFFSTGSASSSMASPLARFGSGSGFCEDSASCFLDFEIFEDGALKVEGGLEGLMRSITVEEWSV